MWPLCDTLVIFAYEMRNKNAMNLAFYVPVYYGLLENDNMCESRERERERESALGSGIQWKLLINVTWNAENYTTRWDLILWMH